MKSRLFSEDKLAELGILDWGYTEELEAMSFDKYSTWIDKKLHGSLSYLEGDRGLKRSNLKNVFPEAESALVFLFDYRSTKKWMLENNHHVVAAYTLGFSGEDYHFELSRRLDVLKLELEKQFSDFKCQISLDVLPVLERDLAYRAGLGWFGKNSMLIHRKYGSYFIIGSLLINKKLEIDSNKIETDHCGQCTRCIDQCPTEAIDTETRTLIADKCISTYTIEVFKEVEAPQGMINSRGEIFGCDICQDVCPWNKKTLRLVEPFLFLKDQFQFLKKIFYESTKVDFYKELEKKSNREVKRFFKGTSFDRPGKIGLMKNLKLFFKSN